MLLQLFAEDLNLVKCKECVSIPQAVSAVATFSYTLFLYYYILFVSIPQAVSAVATVKVYGYAQTVSGVSIPQAVSAVATNNEVLVRDCRHLFQYRKR